MDSAQPVPPFDKRRPRPFGRANDEAEDVQGHVLPGGRTRPRVQDDDDHDDRD